MRLRVSLTLRLTLSLTLRISSGSHEKALISAGMRAFCANKE